MLSDRPQTLLQTIPGCLSYDAAASKMKCCDDFVCVGVWGWPTRMSNLFLWSWFT